MNVERISAPGFEGYVKSEIGGRKENQDSYGWISAPVGLIVTVCDGMGGGPAGKMASSISVDSILKFMIDVKNQRMQVEELVVKAIEYANLCVYEKACAQPELMGMGSTCTVLVLKMGTAVLAHVGDSRIYQLRGHKKVFRTFDHSLVFELVKQKVITEEQARQSSQSNIITRALGLKDKVEIDITTLEFKRGDRFMLSSDGIHGSMPEKDLLEIVSDRQQTVGDIVAQLAAKVDEMGKEKGGGHDNMTLVLIDCNEESVPGSDGFFGKICDFFKNMF